MNYRKIKIFVCISFCILMGTSFHVQDKTIDHFAPCKKFEWLYDFKVLSECLSIDFFEKTKGRTFDSSGIYMADGKYHPVNVFHYGIMCFDMYRKTGKVEYKKKCIDQFNYFSDTSKYVLKEDGSIGFPYKMTFRDLKPPWFSGLAQAEGILYLVRYYYLTKDERALEFIQRVKKFMLKTVDHEGTLNILSDSTIWIEEYVNSKQKAQVINGFVTAIMGLRDYCNLFPSDIETKKILDKCVYSHKVLFYKYDLGNGIYYDLGEKQIVGAWYNKWQVIQMKQMFEIFGDTFYKNIEMLWAYYAYNKPISGMIGCLLNDTNFSSPAKQNPDGWIEPGNNFKELLSKEDVNTIDVAQKMNKTGINNLFDKKEQTNYLLKNNDSISQPPFISVSLKKTFSVTDISLRPLKDTLDYGGYKLFVKAADNSVWEELKIKSISKIDKNFYFSFKETQVKQFKIEFNLLSKKSYVQFSELNLLNSRSTFFTHFTHYTTNDYALSDSVSRFRIDKKEIDDFVVFYKTGNTAQDISRNKWNVYEGIRTTSFQVKSKDKFCRFIVIFKNNKSSSRLQLTKLS